MRLKSVEGDEPGNDREEQAHDYRDEPEDAGEDRAVPTGACAATLAGLGVAWPRCHAADAWSSSPAVRRSRRARRIRSPAATSDGEHQVGGAGVAVELDAQESERIDDGERCEHDRGDADDGPGVLAEELCRIA